MAYDQFQNNSRRSDEILSILEQSLESSFHETVIKLKIDLAAENSELLKEIDGLKIKLETNQYTPKQISETKNKVFEKSSSKCDSQQFANVSAQKPPKKEGKNPTLKAEPQSSSADAAAILDVRRLDFRVGRIVSIIKHPDADSLYVEEVDVGESKPRTVVSGLVKHIEMNSLLNAPVVLLCNLKPAKMRGILSQAMVMCASTPEKVETLIPPEGSEPGDKIEFEGYPRSPDEVLNPKKKIFESLAPSLKTDDHCVATYDGVPFVVSGKGVVKAKTLAGVPIK